MNPTYLAVELKLVVRQPAFLFFTIALPTAMFLIFSGLYGGDGTAKFPNGTPVSAATMVSMASFAAMSAALFTGARIALERQSGWNRQLRLTPLSGPGYLVAKGLVAFLVAVPAIAGVLLAAVLARGIGLDPSQWALVVVNLWVGVIPFALMGMAIGQFGSSDSVQAITPAVMMVMAMAGGQMMPVEIMPGWVQNLAKAMPTYWLRDSGISVVSAGTISLTAIAVLAAWAVVLGAITIRRFRTDTARA